MKKQAILPTNRGWVIFLFSLILSYTAQAQTHYARSNGSWHETFVWSTIATSGTSCNCIPGPGDDVVINGYDVNLNSITGDIAVNSISITNIRGVNVSLNIQEGTTLTVSTDFEIESSANNRDAELTVEGNDSRLNILGDFIADQNLGDDLLIDIDDNSIVDIGKSAYFLQDGGDDMQLNLNINSGNAAQWNVIDTMRFIHNGGDDFTILVDDEFSTLSVDGDLNINLNSGGGDDFTLNIDNGLVDIQGNLNLSRSLTTAEIDIDIDGGILNCEDIVVISSGALATDGAVHFYLDGSSEINCNSFSSTFTGSDDFFIRLNNSNGNSAKLNIAADMTVIRENGDDIELYLLEDESEINVGGNVLLRTTGGEDFNILLDNGGKWTTDGNFIINSSGGNNPLMQLTEGSNDPLFSVLGDFEWLNHTGNLDATIDLDGGLFNVDGNFTLTNANGADDLDLELDENAQITIGQDFLAEITGGDDIRVRLGENAGGSTAHLAIGGDATFILSSADGPNPIWNLYTYEETGFSVGGDLILTTDFTITELCLINIRDESEVTVFGDVDMNAIGDGELSIKIDDDGFFKIGGNFLRDALPNQFGNLDANDDNGTVQYMGDQPQIIAESFGSGTDAFYYKNLEVINSFVTMPQLTLEGLVLVNGDLTMNDGVIASDVVNILVVNHEGTTSNASNDSYVDGYMRKAGDEDFTFPSGNGGFYAPISISGLDLPTDRFEAQYIHSQPHDDGYDSTALPIDVQHLSQVEYWRLNRTAGSAEPTVTLSWDTPRSGGTNSPMDMRVMRWDGSSWQNEGSTNLLGGISNGTLDNDNGITVFNGNPLTFGSINFLNTLPIELVSFEGVLKQRSVALNWTTQSESNNDYFTIEKSKNGSQWHFVDKIDGAGNSSVLVNYSTTDYEPYLGVSYYRLKQTDYNGDYDYSDIITIQNKYDSNEINLYPNPANHTVTILSNQAVTEIKLYNAIGQVIPIQYNSNNGYLTMSTNHLKNGVYLVKIVGKNEAITKQLIIQH